MVFVEGSESEYFGWYFAHICQYSEGVTDIWKQVHKFRVPFSLKFTTLMIFLLRVYV